MVISDRLQYIAEKGFGHLKAGKMGGKILMIWMLSTAIAAQSQTLHENVAVEGVFKAEIVDRDRINVFPRRSVFTIERETLPIDTVGVTANFVPTANPLSVTGWRATREPSPRGYIDLSLGSWLNSSLSAGYGIIRKKDTNLSISFQHNSTSLWEPKVATYLPNEKRFRYDETLSARFSHQFAKKGQLDASLSYHFGYFNYYAFDCYAYLKEGSTMHVSPTIDEIGKAPTQTLNDISIRAGWLAESKRGNDWNVALDMRYYGYRSLYLPYVSLMRGSGERETTLNLSGDWRHTWKGRSSLGVKMAGTGVFYSGKRYFDQGYNVISKPESYGNLTFTPYYRFAKGEFMLNVGANIDLTFNASGDREGSHYSLFHISPNVRIDWRRGAAGLYLNAGGGTELQTLSHLASEDYYRMPALSTTQPIYTPIDARLGGDFGPFNGFSAGASIAFRASKHVPLDGWYMTLLNYNNLTIPGLSEKEAAPAYGTSRQGIDLHGFSFDLHASYQLGEMLKVNAGATYQPQDGETGWYNGIDRARWTLKAEAEGNFLKNKLNVALGYEYRGVRSVYTTYMKDKKSPALSPTTRFTIINGGSGNISGEGNAGEISGETSGVGLAYMRLPDITDLYAKVSYEIMPRLRVGVSAYNLLNRRIYALPSMPTEGIDIQGNLSWSF